MNVIFILIAISLLVAIGFLIAFFWSIRSGQYEDEYTPSVRILFEDEKNIIEEIPNSKFQIPNKIQIRIQKKKKKTHKTKTKKTKQQYNHLTKNQ